MPEASVLFTKGLTGTVFFNPFTVRSDHNFFLSLPLFCVNISRNSTSVPSLNDDMWYEAVAKLRSPCTVISLKTPDVPYP